MHQPQANQLTLNEFQGSNSETNLGRYLLEIFKKFNKFINLWVVNLSRHSPVFKIFTSLNIVLILTILALFAFGLRTWIYPKYPDKVDGENLLGTSRELAPLEIARQNQPPQSVNEVVSHNLFREERDEFLPPPPPQPSNIQVAEIPQRPTLPSPELTLRGVMLLNSTKIAILEGSYPVMKGNKTVKTPIKRKGYYLGDRIGEYKIAQIEKNAVTLNTPLGQILTVKLIRRVPKMDKAPKKKQPKVISTRPNVKKRPQPSQRISGALTAPPPRHISGS